MTTLVFVALAQGDQQAGYTASFPDLPDIAASGADMAELVTTAREAVLKELQRIADDGREWPKPTPIENFCATSHTNFASLTRKSRRAAMPSTSYCARRASCANDIV